jgi:NAD(P)-dependent dehydrogenase (short-subunit alcohol dehydrogenase family)
MAIDYAPIIRVNEIAPGWILTPLLQNYLDRQESPENTLHAIEERQIMKRVGQPIDIGYAVAFLVSDEASFITGAQLFVDGGQSAILGT